MSWTETKRFARLVGLETEKEIRRILGHDVRYNGLCSTHEALAVLRYKIEHRNGTRLK